MITLYHYWSSVCAQKVRMVLAEKGIEWESRHVDLFEFEHWQPWFLEMNPKAVVPVLEEDGGIVTESNIICEYLEDRFPGGTLRPDDPHRRASMRRWMLASEVDLHGAIADASFNRRHRARMLAVYSIDQVRERLKAVPNTQLAETMVERLEAGLPQEIEDKAFAVIEGVLDRMEADLANGPWLLGNTFTLADIAMAPYINRIEVLARPEMIEASERPRIADWWLRVQATPSFQEMMSFKNPNLNDPLAR